MRFLSSKVRIVIGGALVTTGLVMAQLHFGPKPKSAQPQKPASSAGSPLTDNPPATPAATPSQQASPRTQQEPYPIQDGDTLWWLSEAACGNALRYTEITYSDGTSVDVPERIHEGQSLLFPSDCPVSADFNPHRAMNGWARQPEEAPVAKTIVTPPAVVTPTLPPIELTEADATTALNPLPTTTITATTEATSVPAPLPKNGGFWTVRFTAEETQRQWSAVQAGTFFALELANQQQKGKWEGRWKQSHKTHAVVTKNSDGTMNVAVWLKKTPQPGTVVTLVPGTHGMVLPGNVLLNQGAPTRGSPELGKDPHEKAHEKILCATFMKEPNLATRGLLKVGMPVARTAVGYAMGGPILATLVNVPSGLKWFAGKITPPSVAVPQQNAAPQTEQPTTEVQPTAR